MSANYKGYNLFFDLGEEELRSRNQAVVMANIALDHRTGDKKISPQGTALILGYFNEIAPQFRKKVFDKFQQRLQEEGFIVRH